MKDKNDKELKVFKIKDSITGLFSTGGCDPSWTKRGKTWNGINHVKTHLRQFCDYKNTPTGTDWRVKVNNIPETWVVVELSVGGIREFSAKELYPNEFPS